MLAALGAAEVITLTDEFPVPLGYTVELPDDYDPDRSYPLIVAIHGFGDRMAAYLGTAGRLCPSGAIGLYPESPYPMPSEEEGPLGFTWEIWADTTEWYGGTMTRDASIRWIVHVIEKTIADYPVAPDQVFLFGFSQGGMLTYQVGLRRPDLFAGLLPAGGWLGLDSAQALPAGALTTPVRILHGEYDDVCKFESALRADSTLSARGVPVELMRYPVKHILPRELFEDAHDFIRTVKNPVVDASLDDRLFPEEPMPPEERAELMLDVLSLDASTADIAERLVQLYRTDPDILVKRQAVYLLGARRCTDAEAVLAGILSDASGPQELRQAAYSALIKLSTESAWQTVEETELEVAVRDVVPGSQADSVGIRKGDAFLSYDGKAVSRPEDILAAKQEVAEGREQVVIVVRRGTEEMEFAIKPGSIGIWTEQRPR